MLKAQHEEKIRVLQSKQDEEIRFYLAVHINWRR